MYEANMEKARQIMKTMPCSNGLCDQVKCALRHTRPPTRLVSGTNGRRRGILDRAISDEEREKKEEEEIDRALVESLHTSLCCLYCGSKFDNDECLQAAYCGEMDGALQN